jgi:hypothetical protein
MKRTHSLFQQKPGKPDKNRLWSNIEGHILTDQFYEEINREKLQAAIKELPETNPAADLWRRVETHINRNEEFKPGIITLKRSLQIAATVIFAVGGLFLFRQVTREKLAETKPSGEESVEVFLARICEAYPRKCSDADFVEMQKEILRLQQEKESVQNSIFGSPDDAEMMQVKEMINYQIGSMKSQITHYVRL